MRWSELQPQVRAAILAAAVAFVALLIWSFFVSPMSARRLDAQERLAQIERQLEAAERVVEGVLPPSEAERAAWQASLDELVSRLGPESELPLLLESLTRLADAQGVELFLTSGASSMVGTPATASGTVGLTARVFGSVSGTQSIALSARVFGNYEAISRFLSQVGRLGWLLSLDEVRMARSFPEVVADARMTVFFRADASSAGSASAGQQAAPSTRGARGGGNG